MSVMLIKGGELNESRQYAVDRNWPTPIGCWVTLDGAPIPCTVEDLGERMQPTIMDDLSIDWGRQTTIDQPDIGTCTFNVRERVDQTDPFTAFDVFSVGRSIEVWAEAFIPPFQGNLFPDGSFAGGAGELDDDQVILSDGVSSAYVDATATKPPPSQRAVWFSLAASTGQAFFPPARFRPTLDDPDAWDQIPRMPPDAVWEFSAWVKLPGGGAVYPVAFDGPWKDHRVDLGFSPVVIEPALGWRQITGTIHYPTGATIPDDGYWVGLGFDFRDNNPRKWSDGGPGGAGGLNPSSPWSAETTRWLDWSQCGVADLNITATSGSVRDALVWSGEITSITATAAESYRMIELAVTCSDVPGTRLENDAVGDEPWPVHTIKQRAEAILNVANIDVRADYDPGISAFEVGPRDVDAQPALSMLQDLAQSAGAVAWTATHATSGPFLWFEDPAVRDSVRRFMIDNDTGLVVIGDATRNVALMSARDILRDPVQWVQDVSQAITTVNVVWSEPGVDEENQPTTTERTTTRTDDAAVQRWGRRRLSVSTELINEIDAANLADRLLAQARRVEWMTSGHQIDTRTLNRDIPSVDYAGRLNACMDLLDGTARIGHAMTVIEIPVYNPANSDVMSAYVEGGRLSWTDHRWVIELDMSPATAQGYTARWQDMNESWRWQDIDPAIRWSDAYGVGV